MKKIFKIIITFLLVSLFVLPFLAIAQDVTLDPPGKVTEISQFLDQTKNFLWLLVAPLSTIMMIWAGILFLTSEGDPEKVRKAKTLVTYIVIGIVVALIATGLSLILQSLVQ